MAWQDMDKGTMMRQQPHGGKADPIHLQVSTHPTIRANMDSRRGPRAQKKPAQNRTRGCGKQVYVERRESLCPSRVIESSANLHPLKAYDPPPFVWRIPPQSCVVHCRTFMRNSL